MNFNIATKEYNFGDEYTRLIDAGGEYFLCNAPEDVTDERVKANINGSALPPWSYRTVYKKDLPNYEVK